MPGWGGISKNWLITLNVVKNKTSIIIQSHEVTLVRLPFQEGMI